MGGKEVGPTQEFIHKLIAARLAADVLGVNTIVIARTDADGAGLLTSDIDERDHPFLTGSRTAEGFFTVKPGLDQAIARALAYAPYADIVWCETSEPNMEDASRFAHAIHEQYPGKLLAYNCSPAACPDTARGSRERIDSRPPCLVPTFRTRRCLRKARKPVRAQSPGPTPV